MRAISPALIVFILLIFFTSNKKDLLLCLLGAICVHYFFSLLFSQKYGMQCLFLYSTISIYIKDITYLLKQLYLLQAALLESEKMQHLH